MHIYVYLMLWIGQEGAIILAQGLTQGKKLSRIILLLLGAVIQDMDVDLSALYCPALYRLIRN